MLGHHVIFEQDVPQRDVASSGELLSGRDWLDWIQEEARRAQRNLRFEAGAPPLLVQGDAASLEWLETRRRELDSAARALEVDVVAWLVPGSASSVHPPREELERATQGVAPIGRARVRSGGGAVLGERREQSVLGAWSVEVADSSGVAEAQLAHALTGTTLHVELARVDGGKAVFLDGWFDRSELVRVDAIDTGTPDLGVVHKPVLRTCQIVFSTRAADDGVTAVTVRGSAFQPAEWTLWVDVRSQPDPAATAVRLVDLAAFARPSETLPSPDAGGGLASVAFDLVEGRSLFEPLPSAHLAQRIESQRGGGADRRARVLVGDGILVLAADDERARGLSEGFLASSLAARSREVAVELVRGDLRVVAPVRAGTPLRVWHGEERTELTHYEVEIAAQSWMAEPRVERMRDGVWLQGEYLPPRLGLVVWESATDRTEDVAREQARSGRLTLTSRRFQSHAATLEPDEPRIALRGAEAAGGRLEIALQAIR